VFFNIIKQVNRVDGAIEFVFGAALDFLMDIRGLIRFHAYTDTMVGQPPYLVTQCWEEVVPVVI
jgi:hypothetical protein